MSFMGQILGPEAPSNPDDAQMSQTIVSYLRYETTYIEHLNRSACSNRAHSEA